MESPEGSYNHFSLDDPASAYHLFKSPIETLLESLEDLASSYVSLADISQAYGVFSLRVKHIAISLAKNSNETPALAYIRHHATLIARCLQRDLNRALDHPFSEDFMHQAQVPKSIVSTTREYFDEDLRRARDSSAVCQQALVFFSDICKFPSLSSLFPSCELDSLLEIWLHILTAPSLPVLNERKVYAISIWTLSTQALPLALIKKRQYDIVSSVNRAITFEHATGEGDRFICDGLGAIRNLLAQSSHTCLPPIVQLFPVVLAHIVSPSPSIRSQAAMTVQAFSLAWLSTTLSAIDCDAIREEICHFVNAHASSSHKPQKSSRASSLCRLVSAAVSGEKMEPLSSDGPKWALCVLACFTILSDGAIFFHPRFLKLVVQSLAQALRHECSVVRHMHGCVWRCIVWAFARLRHRCSPHDTDSDDAETYSWDTVDRAFLVVKQELSGCIGSALVYCLLGPYPEKAQDDTKACDLTDLTKALLVVKDMVSCADKVVQAEGVAVLARLTGAIGHATSQHAEPQEWSPHRVIADFLADDSILRLDSEERNGVNCAPGFSPEGIRQMSEAEIVRYWDELLASWVTVMKSILHEGTLISPSDDVLQIWQALLLVQTQLTQGNGHLTSPPEFAQRAVLIINQFLAWKPDDTPSVMDHNVQVVTLNAARRLWVIMKHVFAASWVTQAASAILGCVLKQCFILDHHDVKNIWSLLCSDLVLSDTLDSLAVMLIGSEPHREMELKRHLWNATADTWRSSNPLYGWEDTATLLAIPIGSWAMSRSEEEKWENHFRYALSCGENDAVTHSSVLEAIIEKVPSDRRLAFIPGSTPILLTHLHLGKEDAIPTAFVSHINDALLALYPPLPEQIRPALEVVDAVSKLLKSCHISCLVELIVLMSKGLTAWIRDEHQALLDEEYNAMILSLYPDTLKRLATVVPTRGILDAVAPFLCSVFNRVPPPAYGPIAFRRFWDEIQDRLGPLSKSCPDAIKSCLVAYHKAFGGDLPAGITPEFDTQSEAGSETSFPEGRSRGNDNHAHNSGCDITRNSCGVGDVSRSAAPEQEGECEVQSKECLTTRLAASSRSERSPVDDTSLYPHVVFDELRTTDCGETLSPEVPFQHEPPSSVMQGKERQAAAGASFRRSPILRSNSPIPNVSPTGLPHTPPPIRVVVDRTPEGIHRSSAHISRKRKHHTGGESPPSPMATSKRRRPFIRSHTTSEVKSNRINDGHVDVEYDNPKRANSGPASSLLTTSLVRSPSPETSSHHQHQYRTREPSVSSDDYETWETGISSPELRRIQQELAAHSLGSEFPQDTEVGSSQLTEPEFPLEKGHHAGRPLANLNSNSFVLHATPVPYIDRSHSAPISPTASQTVPPLRRAQTTSARLQALQEAYEVVRACDSEMPVEEMLAATRLVHEINGVLNARLIRRLGSEDPDGAIPARNLE